MLKMNSSVLNLWTGALESGRYRKGIGWLGRETSISVLPSGEGYTTTAEPMLLHCPLGVLCEQGVIAGVIRPARWSKGSMRVATYGGGLIHPDEGVAYEVGGSQGNLPQAIMEWAGLDRATPLVRVLASDRKELGLQGAEDWLNISMVNDHTSINFIGIAHLLNQTYSNASMANA